MSILSRQNLSLLEKREIPDLSIWQKRKIPDRVYIISAKFTSAGETGNSRFINLAKEENSRSCLYYLGKIYLCWRNGKFPIYQFGKRGKFQIVSILSRQNLPRLLLI
ncbi:hypothetical protein [Okeania sp. SIO3I5]|uniref:hypothetical protein n=1 Tax=Okeania sp. SIO3I5 TaxID=2607805 RepID=UPI002600BB68|nr:hypothetical protein [Okeania sp. SIO3I5]